MPLLGSIFLDFKLPTAATWFYFSLLLSVALFFKFSRLLSMRNWDVVTIFLLVPGVLLIEDAQPTPAQKRAAAEAVVAELSTAAGLSPVVELLPKPSLKWGYGWLLL